MNASAKRTVDSGGKKIGYSLISKYARKPVPKVAKQIFQEKVIKLSDSQDSGVNTTK